MLLAGIHPEVFSPTPPPLAARQKTAGMTEGGVAARQKTAGMTEGECLRTDG